MAKTIEEIRLAKCAASKRHLARKRGEAVPLLRAAAVSLPGPKRSATGSQLNQASRSWQARNRARYQYTTIKNRAIKAELEFDLTVEFIDELLKPMKCSVTGMLLTYDDTDRGQNHAAPWAPSIDRVDPALGYTRGNVRLVCWAFNVARQAWDDEVVWKWVEGMLQIAGRNIISTV